MTINCKGQLIDISIPKVMGILNITPDSFYDGGKYNSENAILNQVEQMKTAGADFIDIGGYSSKPGANFVTEEEELKRVVSVVEKILKYYPGVLMSIDTFRSKVAKLCIEAGGCMVNDISGGHLDDQMIPTVGMLGVPYIMMHMRERPETMQLHTSYKNLIQEMLHYFSEQILKAHTAKINDIIIDPGFGFAKDLNQNYELLNHLNLLKITEKPILAGISRKSMIYKALGTTPADSLNGTTALNMVALQKGATILRVHDVKEAMECIALHQKLKENTL